MVANFIFLSLVAIEKGTFGTFSIKIATYMVSSAVNYDVQVDKSLQNKGSTYIAGQKSKLLPLVRILW